MTNKLLILTTCPDKNTATTLAGQLVQKKLAACVNIGTASTSIYEWQGNLQHDTEYLLTIKTTKEAYRELELAIQNAHPYELPEIIGVPIECGSEKYLTWVQECIKS